jgi:hypothetical protein
MTVAALEKSVTHRVEEAWLTEQGTLSALVTSSNQRAKWHFFRVRGEQADKIATGNSPRDFTKYFGRLSC